MASGTTQFDRIFHGLSVEAGSASFFHLYLLFFTQHSSLEFRVASSGMAWKGEDSEGVVAIPSSEIKWAQWLRVARNFQLRIGLKDRSKETFDGFSREVCGL